MARDATLLPTFTRATVDYAHLPALSQAVLDYGMVAFHLKLAIDKTMADATVLFTVPAGVKMMCSRVYWEITTTFSGGTNSAIGVSSDDADYSTKGDLLGGAGGDLTATLVSTGRVYKGGTIGAKFGTNGVVVVGPGKVVRYDKIVDTYTAGAGFVHIDGFLID